MESSPEEETTFRLLRREAATGDKKLEGEGKADKTGGKIRNAVGGMKDALRGR